MSISVCYTILVKKIKNLVVMSRMLCSFFLREDGQIDYMYKQPVTISNITYNMYS